MSKKPIFVTFEGIEGSGKSYQSKRLYENLKRKNIPVILTREPGGTKGAEEIRNIILKDYFYKGSNDKFDKYTDTLLYLAARNEHIKKKIKPAIERKKNVICDRFVDSTTAYQVYGKGVDLSLVNKIHKHVLKNLKPNITFILKVKISKAMQRLNKRKKKNRYDKFSRNFYSKVQRAFIKLSKRDKKRYFVLDNSKDSKDTEKIILNKFIEILKK